MSALVLACSHSACGKMQLATPVEAPALVSLVPAR
jgi:hypothetical protein